jgi:2'-5' RNA ligase
MPASTERWSADPLASPPVRAFIGILTPTAAPLLEALRADPDLTALPVRWLTTDGLHLTLAFLGEVPRQALLDSWPAIAAEAARHPPVSVQVGEPEPFSDPQRPRLVAAPLQGDLPLLQRLQAGLAAAVETAGYTLEERPFRAHVTLGRLRAPLLRGQAAALGVALRARQWGSGRWFTVREVALMRSELFPDGARYSVLAVAPLGEKR